MADGGETDPKVDAAYRRGLAEAETRAQIQANKREVADLRKDHDELALLVRQNAESVQSLVNEQGQQKAVQTALAQSVKDTSDKQLSTRTFVLGLVGFLIALAALLFGGGGVIHGSASVVDLSHVINWSPLTQSVTHPLSVIVGGWPR